MKKWILSALMSLVSATAWAGWTSGGGELVRDGQNPWFLSNVSTVNYCIDIDETNFGQTRAVVSQITAQAIANWKLEFSNVPGQDGIKPGIATQTFVEAPCSASTDIRFQFGTLTGEQIKQIEDPTHYIGITVRTDYDRVNMRGKGFVYFSPSRGPLKMESDDLAPEPWALSHGGLLYLAISHELGHVFGLGHSTGMMDVMNERRLEENFLNATAATAASFYSRFPKFQVFKFMPNPGPINPLVLCVEPNSKAHASHSALGWQDNSRLREFFGISPTDKCYDYSFSNDRFEVWVAQDSKSPSHLLGSASLKRFDGLFSIEPLIYMWLPKGQTVFPKFGERMVPAVFQQASTTFKGNYTSADGRISRPLEITVDLGRTFRLGGVINGEMITDLFQGF